MAAKVVTINLGGMPRSLFYGTTATIQAERAMGKSVRDAILAQSIGDLVILLWAGLRIGAEAKLTQDQVARWIDEAKKGDVVVFTLWDPVVEALAASGIIPQPRTTSAPPEDDPTTASPPPTDSQT